MGNRLDRRTFLGVSTVSATGIVAPGLFGIQLGAAEEDAVRIGIIGTGNRGKSLLSVLLKLGGVRVPAVCDIDPEAAAKAQEMVVGAEQSKPEAYTRDEYVYKELLERDDLDAVIIATPWNWHTPMAVDAMKAGKYAGVEVPAAITFEECWDLVNTHEETKVPCMMLENWSFRQDNLAVLNMVRQGVLGDIVHCHCAHSHDCIDHWFFDRQGNMRWGGEFLVKRNCDQYPTHSLGPVLSWLDINCGDAFDYVTSTASASLGINDFFTRAYGADHPNAEREYAQGDIVTTVVKTKVGRTVVINYDMQLPRPYDNRWTLQGTRGIYNEQRNSVYVLDRSPEYHQWEPFPPYQDEFDHPWWSSMTEHEKKIGHGGTDFLELSLFVRAVREKTQTPIDVYDSATMSSIVALSEKSIAEGSKPITCPDYTRGAWKTRKPTFGV